METLNIEKGQKIDLTKSNPGLKIAHVGLGWDINKGTGETFDLDAFAIVLKSGKLYHETQGVVYFNHLESFGLKHLGDNLTGIGDGDDETIKINLNSVPADVDEIIVGVNIYQADSKRQNFGMVNNAFIRVYDAEKAGNNPTDKAAEIVRYDLSEDYSAFTGVLVGKLYRKDGEWKFQALGEGGRGSIADFAAKYSN